VTFSFLHTADWQIGKPFGTIEGEAGTELRLQRIRTARRIAELARERAVDAVLVAGDVFDSNEVSDRTIAKLLEALQPFAGPWVLLPGNHDAALAHSVWTRMRMMGLPEGVIIADRPEAIDCWGGRAAVLPAPLRRRREAHDQTGWFDAAVTPQGCCRIGLAHGSVAGRLPAAAEAANEIPPERAERAGLSYLALGDWHGALKVAGRTWYAGSPEPDRYKANESGQVHLVAVAGPRAPERVETVAVGHFTWARREVELVDGTCEAAIEALRSLPQEPGRCVVSLCLRGSIGLAERLRLDGEIHRFATLLHHLEMDDAGLLDEPTAADLDAIDSGGFVRLALERLCRKATDPSDPDAAAARIALRMVYLDHMAPGRRC
jgi:DNA repair exonuclease SbcCD nuclease subunit